MSLVFTWKLGFHIWKTNVGAQKIDSSALKTFKIVIVDLEIEDKVGKSRFFQKTFLVANIKFEIVLEMLFLKISNADIVFSKKTLMWRFYAINKALLISEHVQIIDLKEFIITALDADSEIFVIHIAIKEQEKMLMHSKK